jgi:plasmid replication initiation protein
MAKAEYVEDEGHILCAFNPYIVPYLIGLRAKFSSYPLKTAVNFSSSYTWRFYELLVSWAKDKEETEGQFLGWISKQPVDDLREMLGVPASYAWSKFETQILQTVQAELLQKANIHVRLTRIKTNRKITHLKIEFIQEGTTPPSPESCADQSTHRAYSAHNLPT